MGTTSLKVGSRCHQQLRVILESADADVAWIAQQSTNALTTGLRTWTARVIMIDRQHSVGALAAAYGASSTLLFEELGVALRGHPISVLADDLHPMELEALGVLGLHALPTGESRLHVAGAAVGTPTVLALLVPVELGEGLLDPALRTHLGGGCHLHQTAPRMAQSPGRLLVMATP
jgi:hypothetical protein